MARKIQLFLFCCLVFSISVIVSIQRNHRWGFYNTLGWDSLGYYIYLPATLVNHGFENLDTKDDKSNPNWAAYRPYPGTKKIFTKYTYGVALTEAPFFILARLGYMLFHFDKPSNIYSATDMVAIIVSDAFYLAAGLFILGLILLPYFDLKTIFLTETIIWLGTSLFSYSGLIIGFSHVRSFFLIASLIYLTPLIYERWKVSHVMIAAVILGLIVLIRPTNIVIVLYPLLYNVYTWDQFIARIRLLADKWGSLLWFPVFGVLAWIPQLIYWYYLSGHWLLYSYDQEGFIYWRNPKVFSVLFHPQNGFFLFAPLMFISMIGLYQLFRHRIHSPIAILLIFLATDYICGSWWYWNFGGAYGFRPYIDYLALLAIPMAYFISATRAWSVPVRSLALAAVIFLLFLSLRLQIIYEYPWEGSHWGWDDILRVHKEALFIK